jgi:hypothetical protein
MNKEQIAGMLTWINRHDSFVIADPVTVNAWHDVLKYSITAEWCKEYLINYYSRADPPRITAGAINEAWLRQLDGNAVIECRESKRNAVPMPDYIKEQLRELNYRKAI